MRFLVLSLTSVHEKEYKGRLAGCTSRLLGKTLSTDIIIFKPEILRGGYPT